MWTYDVSILSLTIAVNDLDFKVNRADRAVASFFFTYNGADYVKAPS